MCTEHRHRAGLDGYDMAALAQAMQSLLDRNGTAKDVRERHAHELVEVRFEGGFLDNRRVLMCDPPRTLMLEQEGHPLAYVRLHEDFDEVSGETRRIASYGLSDRGS